MREEIAIIDVLSTALRVICKPEDLETGIVENVEYNLAFVDILSVGEENKAIFLDLFKEFKSVGSAVQEYNQKFPGRRDELLNGFISTWLVSHPPEEFYGSSYQSFLVK